MLPYMRWEASTSRRPGAPDEWRAAELLEARWEEMMTRATIGAGANSGTLGGVPVQPWSEVVRLELVDCNGQPFVRVLIGEDGAPEAWVLRHVSAGRGEWVGGLL